jgi:hypothetical protein
MGSAISKFNSPVVLKELQYFIKWLTRLVGTSVLLLYDVRGTGTA